jgi:hypothetical protein
MPFNPQKADFRKGEAFYQISFPPVFLPAVAAVLVQWGSFETDHDLLLKLVHKYNNSSNAIDKGFSRKRVLLKREAKIAFDRAPKLLELLTTWLGKANSLYKDRNILAHGKLGMEVKIKKDAHEFTNSDHVKINIVADGESGGSLVTKVFSMQDLEDLYYNIANAHVVLGIFMDATDIISSRVPSNEKSVLQDFREWAVRNCPQTRKPDPNFVPISQFLQSQRGS